MLNLIPGNVVTNGGIKTSFYEESGKTLLETSYKPHRRSDCFVSIFLGHMPKTENPSHFAIRRLKELGWTPPEGLET